MSANGSRAERVRDWFFPPEVELPEPARAVLRTVFPTLDLGSVRFHRGIPHAFHIFAIQGITLPARLSPRRTRIYIAPCYWSPGTVQGLGLILHEAYHALQHQEAGPGIGMLRPFLVLYLAQAARNRFRYAGHPMEDDAFRVAGDDESRFESLFRAAEVTPEGCQCLATPAAGVRFWRQLAGSAPGWGRVASSRLPRAVRGGLFALLTPWVALWLLLWTSVAAVFGVTKWAVEGLGAAAFGLLQGGEAISRRRR